MRDYQQNQLKQGESIRDQAYGGQTYMGEMSWPARFTTPKLTVYQIPEEVLWKILSFIGHSTWRTST